MYEDIDMSCVSKSDFLILCNDCVNARMEYEKSRDETSFIKYSTIVECIYTLGLDYEFGQFCAENKTMKELMK